MTTLFKSTVQAKNYVKFRPKYPIKLYEKIVSSILIPQHQQQQQEDDIQKHVNKSIAIDVGCGTGQATVVLAYFFDCVVGIDPSEAQIKNATQHHKVLYQIGKETMLPAQDKTVTLVTVAQAVHWFDINTFYQEVHRVLRPGGCLAMWSYGLFHIHNDDDERTLQKLICESLYEDLLGEYWDERRRLVENRYEDIPLLAEQKPNHYTGCRIAEGYDIRMNFSKEELIGYLKSWSAYVTYCKQHSIQEGSVDDPIENIKNHLDSNPKYATDCIEVTHPVALLISVKNME
jgi:SAM-dependent methyltransferase